MTPADASESPTPPGERVQAYSTPRSDVGALVPAQALRILDLGCSVGSLGAWLKQVDPRRTVVGMDYDGAAVVQARGLLDATHLVDLEQPDALEVLGDQVFDCVVMADVLEHLRQPAQVLHALRPRLSPGGSIVASLPNIRHVSALHAIYLKGQFPQRERGLFDSTHLRWFTYRDMQAFLRSCGFEPEARMFNLRWGDQGGGRANRLLNRLSARQVERLAPVREFLAYQIVLRCRMVPVPAPACDRG